MVVSLVQTTRFGQFWLLSTTFSLAASLTLLVARQLYVSSTRLVFVCIAGTALARSHLSRSVEAGVLSLPVLADYAHLMAVSAWLGTVSVVAFIVFPKRNHAELGNTASVLFARFLSAAALAALVVLLVAGGFNGVRLIETPAELVATRLGKLLVLKLALVSAALALAASNRFLVLPRLSTFLQRQDSAAMVGAIQGLRRVLQLESVVLGAALVTAALLVASPAP